MTTQTTKPVVGRRTGVASWGRRADEIAAARVLEIAASTPGQLIYQIVASLDDEHVTSRATEIAYQVLGNVILYSTGLNASEQRAEAAMRLRKGQR